MTSTEKAHLKAEADKAGLAVEPFLRRLVMGVRLQPRPPTELTELLRQLSGIGTNINQIARVANGTGRILKEDMDAIKAMQAQIWLQIKGL